MDLKLLSLSSLLHAVTSRCGILFITYKLPLYLACVSYSIAYESATDLTSLEKVISSFSSINVTDDTYVTVSNNNLESGRDSHLTSTSTKGVVFENRTDIGKNSFSSSA